MYVCKGVTICITEIHVHVCKGVTIMYVSTPQRLQAITTAGTLGYRSCAYNVTFFKSGLDALVLIKSTKCKFRGQIIVFYQF